MCDHDWILLTTPELEQSVIGYGNGIRACARCLETQLRDLDDWRDFLMQGGSDNMIGHPKENNYWYRLYLLVGLRP